MNNFVFNSVDDKLDPERFGKYRLYSFNALLMGIAISTLAINAIFIFNAMPFMVAEAIFNDIAFRVLISCFLFCSIVLGTVQAFRIGFSSHDLINQQKYLSNLLSILVRYFPQTNYQDCPKSCFSLPDDIFLPASRQDKSTNLTLLHN